MLQDVVVGGVWARIWQYSQIDHQNAARSLTDHACSAA